MQRGKGLLGKSVIAIALASVLSDLGHETATALLPGFLTIVLAAPPLALGLVEGFSDLVAAGAKLYSGAPVVRLSFPVPARKAGNQIAGALGVLGTSQDPRRRGLDQSLKVVVVAVKISPGACSSA